MVKDASNNWALNSATGGLDSFKAYQSTNSGDTYINASNTSGVVRVNYETGAGAGFNIYGGGSSALYASFTGTTSIKFPGLAASGGQNCLQIDNSGYITNTGSACGTGSGSGTVNSGTSGQIAYYAASGTAVGGMNTVPVTVGGTGAATAAGALANLGGLSLAGGTLTGPLAGTAASFSGAIAALTAATSQINGVYQVDGVVYSSVNAAVAACLASSATGCTIDARGGLGSHALGSFDPGNKQITLLLGPYRDYTVGTITLEHGFHLIGNNTLTTVLTSNSTTNAPVFVIPQVNNALIVGVEIKDLTVLPAPGATTQIGLDVDSHNLTLSGLEYSEFQSVWFGSYQDRFPGGGILLEGDLGGSTASLSPIQFNHFLNVYSNRANGSTQAGVSLIGDVGNNDFEQLEVDADNWSDTTTACNLYIGNPSGTENPYSDNFEHLIDQGGTCLIQFHGANGINIRDAHHEGVAGLTNGYLFTLGGSQNWGINVDGAYFAGVIGTTPGTGYLFNTQNGGTAVGLHVSHSCWAANVANVVLGFSTMNHSQDVSFTDNFANVNALVNVTPQAVPGSGISGTILSLLGSKQEIVASYAGPVTNLASSLMPGNPYTITAQTGGWSFTAVSQATPLSGGSTYSCSGGSCALSNMANSYPSTGGVTVTGSGFSAGACAGFGSAPMAVTAATSSTVTLTTSAVTGSGSCSTGVLNLVSNINLAGLAVLNMNAGDSVQVTWNDQLGQYFLIGMGKNDSVHLTGTTTLDTLAVTGLSNGSGFESVSSGTFSASIGVVWTQAITWPVPMPDTNYRAGCTLVLASAGTINPTVWIAAKTKTGVTAQVFVNTEPIPSGSYFDCWASHN